MSKKKVKWYMLLWGLIVHTVTGLAYFAAMAVPAVIICKVNKWLTVNGVEGFTMTMLYGAESLFLVFDFYAICRYIYRSVREDH